MKNIFAFILLCSIGLTSCSKRVSGPAESNYKGVQFKKETMAKIMKSAEQQNKPILIDFYTTWCTPCKWLDADVFENETVGMFFNDNFINLKVDAEKGEGPTLATKYAVYGYPTLVYLDSEGNVINQHTGMTTASHVMNMGQQAIDATQNLTGD